MWSLYFFIQNDFQSEAWGASIAPLRLLTILGTGINCKKPPLWHSEPQTNKPDQNKDRQARCQPDRSHLIKIFCLIYSASKDFYCRPKVDNCSLHEKTQEDQIINTIKLFNYQLFYEDFTSNDFLWIEIPLIIGSFRSLFARSFSDNCKNWPEIREFSRN